MANSVFARNQLLKHGWTEGSGLGRQESGIKEAIKVKIKNDTTGVGHDPGKEFSCHWWDHVFNKAASSITVETTEEGVQFKKSFSEENDKDKTLNKKNVLYSGFVKGAVLQADDDEVLTEVSCHGDSESDSGDNEAHKAISKLTEEELFTQCEGRTAHKGARHGLKQNAKLLRIQQQEQLLLEQTRRGANQNRRNRSPKEDTKRVPNDKEQDFGLARNDVSFKRTVTEKFALEIPTKKKRRKTKQKHIGTEKGEDCDVLNTEFQNDAVTDVVINNTKTETVKKVKHKKSKKKKRTAERELKIQ